MFLGMRVRAYYGLKTLLGLGPQIDKAGAQRPDGLLHYEKSAPDAARHMRTSKPCNSPSPACNVPNVC